MPDNGFKREVLEDNLRCKIIYYSCINPSTISELNSAWGYSSPTYLYQKNSMEKLKDADLIQVEKQNGKNLITSNYDALFHDENLEHSREAINFEILKEFLIQSKGFHPGGDHPDLDSLLEMGRNNLDREIEKELRTLEFERREFDKLIELWRTDVFKQVFLSLDITTKLAGDRKSMLPANPLNYLFKLTTGVMSSITRGRGRMGEVEIPPDLSYRAEKIIVPAYRALEQMQEDKSYDEFTSKMGDTYSMFRTKFRHERYNYDFMEKFVDLTIKDTKNTKITDMFEQYRDRLF